jgi:hypothetical protein
MARLDTAETPSITLEEVANDGSSLTNPNADHRRLFLGEDGLLHVKDSAGAVTNPYSTGIATFSGAVITEATSQSLTNDTVTALTSNDAEVADTDSYHSTVTNTERLTNTLGGTYWFKAGGTVFFAASATGLRGIRVRANGTTLIDISQLDDVGLAAGGSYLSIATGPFQLANNEYVELMAHQTSGGALNAQMQRFWIERIGS